MRFLIFSDTHGRREPMLELYKKYPNDGIIHLGDYIADACWMRDRTSGHPVYAVRGNCDYGDTGPEELLLQLGGVTLLLTHGHRYRVKDGYETALQAAAARGASVLLFGHTHRPFLGKRNGVLMMNPGSLHHAAGEYGILEINDNQAKGALLHQYD